MADENTQTRKADPPSPAATGMVKTSSRDVIPSVSSNNPVFTLVSSLGFAALFAELIFFIFNYYNTGLSPETGLLAIGAIFFVSLAGLFFSFSLPHLFFRSRFENYSPIIFLVREWTAAIMIVLLVAFITLGTGIYLVGGNLGAIGELLRSLALYTVVAIVCYHGQVTFARYVQYLYERELHQSYKIVTAAGLTVVILLIVTLYLLQYDLGRMGGTDPKQDLISFHLSLRDIWLISMNIFVLFWNYSRLADH